MNYSHPCPFLKNIQRDFEYANYYLTSLSGYPLCQRTTPPLDLHAFGVLSLKRDNPN